MRIFLFVLVCLPHLSACSSIRSLFGAGEVPPVAQIQESRAKPQNNVSSKHAWAVQYYEMGSYEEALERFDELAAKGTNISGFELVSYYQAMCHFHLGESKESLVHFAEFFAQNLPKTLVEEEARVTYLLALEQNRRWDALILFAAESEPKIYHRGFRILLKLLWSEALSEKGQWVGAKHSLEDAQKLLKGIPEGSFIGNTRHINQQNLQDRSLWLSGLLSIRECHTLKPPKKAPIQLYKKRYKNWYHEQGSCLKNSIERTMPSFSSLSHRWNAALVDTLNQGIQDYYDMPDKIVQKKLLRNVHQAREFSHPLIKKHFYQIIQMLENLERQLPHKGLRKKANHRISQKIEYLLHKIAILSSSTDRNS